MDADTIVYQLLSPKSDVGIKVVGLLGAKIITGDQIDRTKVANIVFKEPQLLAALERIIHPEVQKSINLEYERVASQVPLFVAEIPLLFEANLASHFDTVIALTTDPQTARQRFAAKTGYEPLEYDRRTARLFPQEKKAQLAHYHIVNNTTESELRFKVESLCKKIQDGLA